MEPVRISSVIPGTGSGASIAYTAADLLHPRSKSAAVQTEIIHSGHLDY